MMNALVGHLVGDYLLQNDWMALNKKKHSFPCVVHCLLWTLTVCMMSNWWNPFVVAVLFATHFIQDRTSTAGRTSEVAEAVILHERCVNRVNGRWCQGMFIEIRQHVVRCSGCGQTRFATNTPINYRDDGLGIHQPLGVFTRG